MRHLKTYKIFEAKESILDLCWYNSEIDQILPQSDIFDYIKKLHRNKDDFYDGDLGERIGEFSKYKLMEIDTIIGTTIDKINEIQFIEDSDKDIDRDEKDDEHEDSASEAEEEEDDDESESEASEEEDDDEGAEDSEADASEEDDAEEDEEPVVFY